MARLVRPIDDEPNIILFHSKARLDHEIAAPLTTFLQTLP